MADIHILQKGADGRYSLVFHFSVAAGDNDVPGSAGGMVTWREALVVSLGGSPTSTLPSGDGTKGTISSAEAADLAAGTVLERSYSFPLDSGGSTNAQRAASVRAFYVQKKAEVTAEIQASLGYCGAILDEV